MFGAGLIQRDIPSMSLVFAAETVRMIIAFERNPRTGTPDIAEGSSARQRRRFRTSVCEDSFGTCVIWG